MKQLKCCLCKKELDIKGSTIKETNIRICHKICFQKARQRRLLILESYFFNQLTNF